MREQEVAGLVWTIRSRSRPQRGAAPAGQGWVRQAFGLPADAAVLVTELRCPEPGGPPLETVIALLRGPGAAREHKIHHPLVAVTEADVLVLAGGEKRYDERD